MHLRQAGTFVGLVTLLTLPFWLLGAFSGHDIAAGLPISALAVVCPAAAAFILVTVSGGWPAAIALLRQAVSFRGSGWRFLLIVLINPALFGLSLVLSRAAGADIPAPEVSVRSLGLLAMFLPAALLEEIGWSAYALERLQQGMRLIWAALAIGIYWAAWHLPALVQAERSLEWIAWWSVWTLGARLVMVWAYATTGRSVLPVVAYHALSNVCWQLYPVGGSHFDPQLTGLITVGLASVLVPALAARVTPFTPLRNPEPASRGTP